MSRLNIAVIGSGVSGLGAAWLLAKEHNVTLFERENRAGGHANTVTVEVAEGKVAVDTGFIVYNTQCYPNLIGLFKQLAVPTAPSSMTFAVSLDGGAYEYSGSGASGLFGQRANLWSAGHWRMLIDIRKFFRAAAQLQSGSVPPADGADAAELSLADWLAREKFSSAFIERHIVPMASAIWSAPPAEIMKFPAVSFARFFANHGLLQARNRPEWRTVQGGSQAYVSRLLADFNGQTAFGNEVAGVRRLRFGVELRFASGHRQVFDRCLFACHADQALALLNDADDRERRLLGAFRYQPNEAVLHTDPASMPQRRSVWASWNVTGTAATTTAATAGVAVTYWMNKLQPLVTDKGEPLKQDLFVTLNPARPVPEVAVLGRYAYRHPLFDAAAIKAQRELWRIQGQRGTWFAGAWAAFGFHEDGLQSGLAAAEDIMGGAGGVKRPWAVPAGQDRIGGRPESPRGNQPATQSVPAIVMTKD
jgi:uncharacterized protein